MIKVNTAQAFSIFIAVLMIGSVIGYSFLLGGSADDGLPSGEKPLDLTQEQLNVAQPRLFVAENVSARVAEIFPSIVFTANSSEKDSGKINSRLLTLPGVLQAQGQIAPSTDQEITAGQTFVGNASFSESTSREKILESIKGIEFFSGVEVFSQALIEVQKKVTFASIDDANTFKEYEFTENFVPGLISISTEKNDSIGVLIQGVFQESVLSQAMVFEAQNFTRTPVFFSAKKEFKIKELTNEVPVSGITSNFLLNASALNNEFKLIENVLDANFSMPPFQRVLNGAIDGNKLNDKTLELTETIEAIPGIESASFTPDLFSLNFTIAFHEEISFSELKKELDNLLKNSYSLKEEDYRIYSSMNFFQGEIKLKDKSKSIEKEVNAAAEKLQLSLDPVKQKGFIELESLLLEDSNKTFELESKRIESYFNSGRKENDSVEGTLSVQALLEKVQLIVFIEE